MEVYGFVVKQRIRFLAFRQELNSEEMQKGVWHLLGQADESEKEQVINWKMKKDVRIINCRKGELLFAQKRINSRN